MKSFLSPVLRWAKHLGGYLLAQVVIQGAAYSTGLVLVNVLSVREYSLYTIAISGLITLSALSDMGLSSVLAYFHRGTTDTAHRVAGQQACLRLRRRLMVFGMLVVTPYLVFQTTTVGFSASTAAWTVAIFGVIAAIGYSIPLELMRLRLDGRFGRSYVLEGAINVAKLAWALVLGWAGLLSAMLAFAGGAVANAVGLALARRDSGAFRQRDCDSTLLETYCREAWALTRRTMPNTIYFAAQGPFLVLLAGMFGKQEGIASVGAIGRITLIFTVLSGFVGTVVLPKLANKRDDREFVKGYVMVWAAMLAGGAAILLFCIGFPSLVLKLAGPQYSGLTSELRVACLASVVLIWSGFATGVKHTRGWLKRQDVTLAVLVSSQALLVACIDFSRPVGVFYFQLGSALAALGVEVLNNVVGLLAPGLVAVGGGAARPEVL